jgi:hypothetical protein
MTDQCDLREIQRSLRGLLSRTVDPPTFRWGMRCSRLLHEVARMQEELETKLRGAQDYKKPGQDTDLVP